MFVQPTNNKPKPRPENLKPYLRTILIYAQIMFVNKIYYSYLHMKSGVVCLQPYSTLRSSHNIPGTGYGCIGVIFLWIGKSQVLTVKIWFQICCLFGSACMLGKIFLVFFIDISYDMPLRGWIYSKNFIGYWMKIFDYHWIWFYSPSSWELTW